MTAVYELRIFAGCLSAGILIGVIYDIFSILRYPFHCAFTDGIFDCLFYLLALIISSAALFLLNDGIVRFYSLSGIVCGVAVYMRFPSRLFRRIARKTLKFIHK